MPRSNALKKAQDKYKQKRVQIVLDVSPDHRERINAYCKQFGGTAKHIKDLLRIDMAAHNVVPFDQNSEEGES